ncbi:imelysin family protein [Shewanella surugensis]|uniref:Iron-regulated protein A n=1 Tax=Shewanella surugensis TaxID=212020 RepID=A0ABT0L5E5_9GAMM|nr:imelysin family protein [Shewanella surugensis]MCL1122912.1 iron-regulated protein A precursor [Shewanella surugensis]
MKYFTRTALAMALITTLTACGGSGSDDSSTENTSSSFSFTATETITNLTDDVIVAGYENLALQGDALLLATQTLLNNATTENLLAAQAAWKAARAPWEQGESHIFGPVDALGIDPHLDSWPLNTSDLTKVLANNSGFDAATIKTWNDDVQGFHTMEYLLFGNGINTNEKSIDELSLSQREYLAALAEVFRDYTASLADAWTVSYDAGNGAAYADSLKTPGENNNTFYSSNLSVIQELVNGMIGIVDEVGNGKIADPFGESLAQADTSKVESQYSWNSLTDFSDNIKGVRNVYEGEFLGSSDKSGIVDFVTAADAKLAARISAEINEAILLIEAIAGSNDTPFRQAISDVDGRVRIQAAIDALSTLQTSLENDVIPLLSQWDI